MVSKSYLNSNNSIFVGNSFLKGNTGKEKEVNVMMNLVEQFLTKFDEEFKNNSIMNKSGTSSAQSINNLVQNHILNDDNMNSFV